MDKQLWGGILCKEGKSRPFFVSRYRASAHCAHVHASCFTDPTLGELVQFAHCKVDSGHAKCRVRVPTGWITPGDGYWVIAVILNDDSFLNVTVARPGTTDVSRLIR